MEVRHEKLGGPSLDSMKVDVGSSEKKVDDGPSGKNKKPESPKRQASPRNREKKRTRYKNKGNSQQFQQDFRPYHGNGHYHGDNWEHGGQYGPPFMHSKGYHQGF